MSGSSSLIVFRTDASLEIGSGHVIRCLTLAETLRSSGANVQFACRDHPFNLNDIIYKKGFKINLLPAVNCKGNRNLSINHNVEEAEDYNHWLNVIQHQDAEEMLDVLAGIKPEWLIVDHYGLDIYWENRLRPHVHKLMVIDDTANRQHNCDLLLDQNYFRKNVNRYEGKVPPTCTLLLGPQYALLRPEFAEIRKNLHDRTGEIKSVFVFFGGTDLNNLTGSALTALSSPELEHLKVYVVLGKTNPNLKSIEKKVALRPNTYLSVQIENVGELMAEADIALGAGGTTTWERLCLGLPSIVVVLSENQKIFSEALHKDGLQICLGNANELSFIDLKNALLKQLKRIVSNRKLSEKCLKIVDGNGSEITKDMILNGISVEHWRIRNATLNDCELYWHWVNDPEVRRNAFDSRIISWKTHLNWFRKKLNDSTSTLSLFESHLGPIGQVRFEKSGQEFKIDFSIARQFRGMGLGEKLLSKAIKLFLENNQGSKLVSEVKEENQASKKIFKNIGFREMPLPHQVRKMKDHIQLHLSPKSR